MNLEDNMSKIPVVIDCDPGIDDSIAIIMLAGSDKVDIKAITTITDLAKILMFLSVSCFRWW